MNIILAVRAILWCLVPLYLVFVMPGQIRRAVNAEAEATRAMISGQLTGIRGDVTTRTDAALRRVDTALRTLNTAEADANSQIAGARKNVEDIGKMADVRMAALTDVANSQLSGIRSDLKPTLTNSASLTKDVQESLDDVYWDVKASVESATVTANSMAQASEAVSAAVPHVVRQVDGITSDVHAVTEDGVKAADKFVAPPNRWEKFRAIITGALVVLVKAGL